MIASTLPPVWDVDLYASLDLPPWLSALFIVYSSVAFVIAIIVLALRARSRTALASRAERSVGDEKYPLVEGKDVVLCGIVRHYEANDVAVKVTVTQEGSESESSGSWTHSWTEIDRDIEVAPFLLELPDKELVLVSPPKNVDVADALDQKVWINRNKRVLGAELVPGEEIWARGRLERSDVAIPGSAYRDVAWGWALGPTDGRMLLSSEPLGAGLRQRASFHRRFAWLAAVHLVAIQLSLGWFYGRLVAPTLAADIVSKRYYQTTDSDGDTHDYYEITVPIDTGIDDRTINISDDDYRIVATGTRVPIRVASSSNWNLGASPTLAIWHGIVIFGLPNGFLILYALRRRRSRPWFRRKVNESHGGRLPEPPS